MVTSIKHIETLASDFSDAVESRAACGLYHSKDSLGQSGALYKHVSLWIEDMAKPQTFADRFVNLNWPTILEKYAKPVNPQ